MIPADLSRLPQVRAFAQDAAGAYGFAERETFQIKSALNEAASNAIEHGSPAGADVLIEVLEEAGALVFYVTDRGSFKPRVDARGQFPERGRGLQFLGQMMDDVDVRPGATGTVVRMAKRL